MRSFNKIVKPIAGTITNVERFGLQQSAAQIRFLSSNITNSSSAALKATLHHNSLLELNTKEMDSRVLKNAVEEADEYAAQAERRKTRKIESTIPEVPEEKAVEKAWVDHVRGESNAKETDAQIIKRLLTQEWIDQNPNANAACIWSVPNGFSNPNDEKSYVLVGYKNTEGLPNPELYELSFLKRVAQGDAEAVAKLGIDRGKGKGI